MGFFTGKVAPSAQLSDSQIKHNLRAGVYEVMGEQVCYQITGINYETAMQISAKLGLKESHSEGNSYSEGSWYSMDSQKFRIYGDASIQKAELFMNTGRGVGL